MSLESMLNSDLLTREEKRMVEAAYKKRDSMKPEDIVEEPQPLTEEDERILDEIWGITRTKKAP